MRTLSRRSTKAQVANSRTLALGMEPLKVKSKSSMVLACSKLARRMRLLELLRLAPFHFVGEEPVEKLGEGEVVVSGLLGAELERLQDAGEA